MNICLLTFPMTIFMSTKSLDNISNFFSDNISGVQLQFDIFSELGMMGES